jgi:hypothetical protein
MLNTDPFTLNNIKDRMVVELRNGDRYLKVGDSLLCPSGYQFLDNYTAEMRFAPRDYTLPKAEANQYDIVKVFDKVWTLDLTKSLPIIWERNSILELTIKQLEEEFGCKIKIITEED